MYGLDGAFCVGLFVAPSGHAEEGIENVVTGQRRVSRMKPSLASKQDQGSHRFGVVPPDFLGNGPEELKRGDHALEDRLGALEWQRLERRG